MRIMMAGTMKMPLPMMDPITMPRHENRFSLYGWFMLAGKTYRLPFFNSLTAKSAALAVRAM